MKKTLLLIGVFCATLSLTSFGQQMSSKNHPTPQAVLAIPALKLQAEKIEKKQLEINNAATSSKGVMAQLNQDLTALNQEYKTLLTNALSTCTDENAKKALTEELNYVDQQLSAKTQR